MSSTEYNAMDFLETRVFPAKCTSLVSISLFIEQAAVAAGLDDDATYAIQLAVEEACDNIIEHAYGEALDGDIVCTCQATLEGLEVVLRDHGRPFDPTSVPPPDLASPLEERDVGGLGLHFIRKLTDEFHFEPDADTGNLLRLLKRRQANA